MPRSLSVAALLLLSIAGARADITFLGIGTLPGDSEDLSGLTGKYSDGMPQNRLGGLGSGIAYSGKGDIYILVADGGPKVSDPDFQCRMHKLEIVIKPGTKNPVALKLTATTLLTDEKGKALVGNPARFNKKHPEKSLRFDPEGIRVGRDGSVFISDELGPYLYQFDAEGKRTRAFEVPIKFLPEHPSEKMADELPPKNQRGRIPNRGLEGLAISPDGGKLFALMQSPLLQDGELDENHKPLGHFCRLLELDIATGATREFFYHLDGHGSSLCEIVAVNDKEFLVTPW